MQEYQDNDRNNRIFEKLDLMHQDITNISVNFDSFKNYVNNRFDRFEKYVNNRFDNLENDVQSLKQSYIDLKNEVQSIVTDLKNEVQSIHHSVIIIENDHGQKLDALFDYVVANTEKHNMYDKHFKDNDKLIENHSIRIATLEDNLI